MSLLRLIFSIRSGLSQAVRERAKVATHRQGPAPEAASNLGQRYAVLLNREIHNKKRRIRAISKGETRKALNHPICIPGLDLICVYYKTSGIVLTCQFWHRQPA